MAYTRSLLLLLLLTPFGTSSRADLIGFNFEGLNQQKGLTSFSMSTSFLTMTISRAFNDTFDFDDIAVSQFGNSSLSPFNGINGAAINDSFLFTLSQPVDSISASFGDFGDDTDFLFLTGYESSLFTGNSRSSFGQLPGGGTAFTSTTLSVARDAGVSGFQSFEIGGGGASFPNSVFYDNIVFVATAVPEPNSAILFLFAFITYAVYQSRTRTLHKTQVG